MDVKGLQSIFNAMPEPPWGSPVSVELIGRNGELYMLWSDIWGSWLSGPEPDIRYAYSDPRDDIDRKMQRMADLISHEAHK